MDFNCSLYNKKEKRKIIKEKIQIQHDFKKYTPVLKKIHDLGLGPIDFNYLLIRL